MDLRHTTDNKDESTKLQDFNDTSTNPFLPYPLIKYESNQPLYRDSSNSNFGRAEVENMRPCVNYSNNCNIRKHSSFDLDSQQFLPSNVKSGNGGLSSTTTHPALGLQNCNPEVEYITEEDLDIRHGIMHELPNVGNNDTQKDLRNKNLPAHIRVNSGRWSVEEHNRFLKGLETHPHGVLNRWRKISTLVASRTVLQTRTHAQKYFRRLLKEGKILQSDCKTTLTRSQQPFSFPSFGVSELNQLPQTNLQHSTTLSSSSNLQRFHYPQLPPQQHQHQPQHQHQHQQQQHQQQQHQQQQHQHHPQQQQNSKQPSIRDNRVHEKASYQVNPPHHFDPLYGKRELATSAEESIDWLLNNLETLERVSSAQKVLRNDNHDIGKLSYNRPTKPGMNYGMNNSYNAAPPGVSESFSNLLRQSLSKTKTQPPSNHTTNSAAASGLLYLQQHHPGNKMLFSVSPRYNMRGGNNDLYPLPHQAHSTGMFNSTKDLESVWMLTNEANESINHHRGMQDNRGTSGS